MVLELSEVVSAIGSGARSDRYIIKSREVVAVMMLDVIAQESENEAIIGVPGLKAGEESFGLVVSKKWA